MAFKVLKTKKNYVYFKYIQEKLWKFLRFTQIMVVLVAYVFVGL